MLKTTSFIPIGLVVLLGWFLTGSSWAAILTLDQAYQAALGQSEAIKTQQAVLDQNKFLQDQVLASYRPALTAVGTGVLQDTYEGSSAVSSFFQRFTPTAKLSTSYTIYDGFKDQLSRQNYRTQRLALQSALAMLRQRLYQTVSTAYVQLAALNQSIETYKNQLQFTQQRVDELQQRARQGKSRQGEVLAAQAQSALLRAQIESVRGQIRSAEQALAYYTGLGGPWQLDHLATPDHVNAADFVSKAQGRADIAEAQANLQAAELTIASEKLGLHPNLGLDGNVYLYRTGSSESIWWDTTFTAQWPLYDGGTNTAKVAYNEAARQSAWQALLLAQRKAELDVKTAYLRLESSLSSLDALNQAVALAEDNVKAQTQDYRLGLVTNLEVLSSMNGLQDLLLKRDQVRWDAVLARIDLDVAAGRAEN